MSVFVLLACKKGVRHCRALLLKLMLTCMVARISFVRTRWIGRTCWCGWLRTQRTLDTLVCSGRQSETRATRRIRMRCLWWSGVSSAIKWTRKRYSSWYSRTKPLLTTSYGTWSSSIHRWSRATANTSHSLISSPRTCSTARLSRRGIKKRSLNSANSQSNSHLTTERRRFKK